MQIIRNIELQIHDLHIRFEDNYSKPEHPFSIGVTLKGIEIKVYFLFQISVFPLNSYYFQLDRR
jgi:hypothetical protein